ncbi:hypothetical protein GPJ56_000810 [Histomonas meleagridis]|uniref:uncharacterized protein n=1 Tax=Histomonas meleagridis TaxID=135588 RepID=UPI0035594FB8|nr:hypothetical protein GPJ56_000810 [Histomonas meleagridis]KAH0804431.1 hypothetical protein GO595_003261 [Histomonas meleagridis]
MSVNEPKGTFLTGIDIDVDQWRNQTIEELQGWLDEIKTRKTQMGDLLVEFPDGWDADQDSRGKKQLDIISEKITRDLKGQELKEAQSELKCIRAQADKIRQLDKVLSQLDSEDSDESKDDEYLEDDAVFLENEPVIPKIDTTAPNPFDFTPEVASRLKEIDEKLGISDEVQSKNSIKSLDEVNQELLKLYQEDMGELSKNVK